jgi:NADH-quinone oxidoreductase subunit E
MDRIARTFPDLVHACLAKYPDGHGASAVLELLYLAQAAYGYLDDAAVTEVATLTGLDATRIRGLVGFYSLFYDRPHGRYVIHFCTDLPCALRGADELLPELCARLGIAPGETTPDGLFTLETVKCLAACDRAPVMQVNLTYFHDLAERDLDGIIADLRALAAVDPPFLPPYGAGPPPAAVGHRSGPDA